MGFYDFEKDLDREGDNKEFVKAILIENGFEIIDDNDDYRYDLKVRKDGGPELKLELKEDFMTQKTNNVAIEFESRGRPSGISTSEAQFYIYTVPWDKKKTKDIVFVLVGNLKEFFSRGNGYRTVIGGDKGSNTKMYLVNYKKFCALGNKYTKMLK